MAKKDRKRGKGNQKKKQQVMDEAAKEKFQQKLKDLLALAKKKKNMLEYQEISDFFADMQLEESSLIKFLIFWKQTISMYFGSQMMILMMKFYSM